MTVQYENIVVRGDESGGRLTFILVTSEPAEEPFTVQVCTRELNEIGGGPAGEFATGQQLATYAALVCALYVCTHRQIHRYICTYMHSHLCMHIHMHMMCKHTHLHVYIYHSYTNTCTETHLLTKYDLMLL